MKINNKLKEIMCSKDNLIEKIKDNGFDIFERYKAIKCNFENGLIKDICFELKDNPLDTDWDWNGCIILFFEYKEDKVQCQLQVEAVTNKINYSYLAKYNDYGNNDKFPNFKNEDDFYNGYRCDFCESYDTKYFKTINIFKNITKYIVKCDENIKECIETQDSIDDFEQNYCEKVLDLDSEEKFGKSFDELTKDEQEEYFEEQDGIATYNMMVAEGWLDED